MSSKIEDQMLALAAQCVRCGMCLPHCPTTQLHNTEGQSPRGRIALWQNLAQNTLELTQATQDYLKACLSCGACANNCPAGVKFLELQDLGKQFLTEHKQVKNTAKQTRILITLFSKKSLTELLHYSLYFYQKSRLHKIVDLALRPLPKFRQHINALYHSVPKLTFPTRYKFLYKANTPCNNQNIILFTGCVNKLSANHKITAVIKILNKLEINVHILNDLHCCGAIYQHNGFAKEYQDLRANNQEIITKFLNSASAAVTQQDRAMVMPEILTLDTGCHPTLQQQFKQFVDIKISSIEAFIYEYIKNNNIDISKLVNQSALSNRTIYSYTPCSQREQLKTPNITKDLLNLFLNTQLNCTIKQMPVGYGCCGAAGSYMFDNPGNANKFTKKIIDDLLLQEPHLFNQTKDNNLSPIICTSNIGCSIQIKKFLLENYKITVDIIHPLEIIYKILNEAGIN